MLKIIKRTEDWLTMKEERNIMYLNNHIEYDGCFCTVYMKKGSRDEP